MSQKTPVVLEVKNVTKSFYTPRHMTGSLKESIVHSFKKKDKGVDSYHALKGISFQVKKGEFFGIVGRNGAGKSTLLRILAEIYRPTSGSVHVQGRLVPFIELGVGFNNNLTGRQNVYLNGAMLGFSRKEIDARYDEIVKFAELENFMDQRLKNYSSGMRVRLAFSVAIQADADILLLDEVLAVGDMDFKKKCYSYFENMKNNKKTIIFVSHGMGAVREYCDRAILIEGGKVAFEGSAEAVADRYMQLFDDKKPASHNERGENKNVENRWGSRQVYIHDFDFNKKKNTIKISAHLINGDEHLKGVKFGVAIKDQKGNIIAGFNNENAEGGKKMDFRPHDERKLAFEFPNFFGNREYSVSATLISHNGAKMYDKWNNIVTFSNSRDNVYYPVVCPAKLTIRE